MHRNRFASVFSAAVLAGALAMAGCASAATQATKAAAAGGTSAAKTTSASAVAGGKARIMATHGSFRLGIAGIGKKLTSAYSHWPANTNTCSGSISVTSPAPIVTGSGTGLYRGISGSFNTTVTIDEVDVKPVCNGTSKFLSQVILLVGSGIVSF